MIENFQRLGKYDSLNIELCMCVMRSRVFLRSCVATSAVIKSKPGLLCRGEFLILYTSLSRMYLGDRVQRSLRLVVELCRLLGNLDKNISRVSDLFVGEVGQYVGDGRECTS